MERDACILTVKLSSPMTVSNPFKINCGVRKKLGCSKLFCILGEGVVSKNEHDLACYNPELIF